MSTAYDRVLDAAAAQGMKVMEVRGRDKARAQCPAHGSRGLTLSVARGDDKALVRCFAGCDLDQVLDALGLTRRDLFDGALPTGYRPPPQREPTPWDPITVRPGLDHFLDRVAQQHAAELAAGLDPTEQAAAARARFKEVGR